MSEVLVYPAPGSVFCANALPGQVIRLPRCEGGYVYCARSLSQHLHQLGFNLQLLGVVGQAGALHQKAVFYAGFAPA